MAVIHRNKGVVICLLALSLVSPAWLHAYAWTPSGWLEVAYSPAALAAKPAQLPDLDGDGRGEHVLLHQGSAAILRDQTRLWTSPSSWDVRQVQVTDLNQDGRPEVSLLLWRPFAPWPVDRWMLHGGRISHFQDSRGMACHLILIGWRRGEFGELWAGSALADPLLAFLSADVDANGFQELVGLEGRYDDPLGLATEVTLWDWDGFGFSLRWRGPGGLLTSIATIVSDQDTDLLLVQGIPRR